MNRRTIGIILLIGGVLVFLWATSQISNLPPSTLMRASQYQEFVVPKIRLYRVVQAISAISAVTGGLLAFVRQ